MQFSFKGEKYTLPVTLNEIPLRKKIEFDRLYREEINTMYEKVVTMDDEGNITEIDEIEYNIFKVAVAAMNLSFFSGIPREIVEKEIEIGSLMEIYSSCFHQLYDEQDNIELQEDYLFNNQLWKLGPPTLSHDNKLTFNELVTSKQIIKQMQELSVGKWEAIPYLAVIYLKKEDEEFQEEWLQEGSERLEIMRDLPMNIAVAIAFFLQISMDMFLRISAFSPAVQKKLMDQI